MLTLEKFEQASEIVKRVTNPTKLVYSDYLSQQTGGKVYLNLRICNIPEHISCAVHIIKSAPCLKKKEQKV